MDAQEAVRGLFDAFARNDPAGAESYVHPECRFWPQGTAEALGRTEPYRGTGGISAYFEDVGRAWDSLELQPTDVRSAGAGVICFGVAVGRLKGQVEEQRIPVIWVFRLRDGQIIYGRAAQSAAEARELVAPETGARD